MAGGVRQLWAGNGVDAASPVSTVKVFDLAGPGSGTLAATVSTGGSCRADELAYDPAELTDPADPQAPVGYRIHPGIAEAIHTSTPDAVRVAVDAALAAWWSAVIPPRPGMFGSAFRARSARTDSWSPEFTAS